jgi:hypothetical protein
MIQKATVVLGCFMGLAAFACGSDDSSAGGTCEGAECAAGGEANEGGSGGDVTTGNIVIGCSTFMNREGQNITVVFLDGTEVVFKETDSVGAGTGDCRFTFHADVSKSYGVAFFVDVNGDSTCNAGDYVVRMADVNLTNLMTRDVTIGIGENYPAGDCAVFE